MGMLLALYRDKKIWKERDLECREMLDDYWAGDLLSVRWSLAGWWFSVYRRPPPSSKGMWRLRELHWRLASALWSLLFHLSQLPLHLLLLLTHARSPPVWLSNVLRRAPAPHDALVQFVFPHLSVFTVHFLNIRAISSSSKLSTAVQESTIGQ